MQVVGFVPTGWTYEMKKAAAAGGPYAFPVRSKGPCSVWLIPYSEHSSFTELREYVGFLRPKQVRHTGSRAAAASFTQGVCVVFQMIGMLGGQQGP